MTDKILFEEAIQAWRQKAWNSEFWQEVVEMTGKMKNRKNFDRGPDNVYQFQNAANGYLVEELFCKRFPEYKILNEEDHKYMRPEELRRELFKDTTLGHGDVIRADGVEAEVKCRTTKHISEILEDFNKDLAAKITHNCKIVAYYSYPDDKFIVFTYNKEKNIWYYDDINQGNTKYKVKLLNYYNDWRPQNLTK